MKIAIISIYFWTPLFVSAPVALASFGSLRGLNEAIGHDFGVTPQTQQASCQVKEDCPPVYCLVPPCDFYACGDDGLCVLMSNNDGNNTVSESAIPCGPAACTDGEICCNESCGICTPPDGVCKEEFCLGNEDYPGDLEIPEDAGAESAEAEEEGGWVEVTRGDCECQSLCSVCRNFFGLCVQLYCFD